MNDMALLSDSFARACYIMFLVSEVYPFLDGNGRIARVMMNAELAAKGFSKILIPTVCRVGYLGAIKKLTRKGAPEAYINMLNRAYEFSTHVLSLGRLQGLVRNALSYSTNIK